ncbi:hypothetical protein E0485_16165 [Paenibacillus albiflavus]|uniref:EamA domain-containing protein n=1 Tax=Paenibacillus albiflavus TaxID=2545760 RepID=A0A4R4E815_9BACL|nr:hypothetical protein [Paenibacillus albiflavus]TCZ75906.1 hypothetical protein E0485_16165 [Paenibacillus albiflavus]
MLYLYSLALLFVGLTAINLIFSYQSKHIDPQFWTTFLFQLTMIPIFFVANMCIGYGVKFGSKATHNLAYVLVFSKCLEILIALWMGYWFLKEVPSWKTWIGLGFIAVGVVLVKQK